MQEALTNARKHADATVVRVALEAGRSCGSRSATTVVASGPEMAVGGFGLDSMRQRAALIGGTLTITSEPRGGTRVELAMPLNHGEVTDGGG